MSMEIALHRRRRNTGVLDQFSTLDFSVIPWAPTPNNICVESWSQHFSLVHSFGGRSRLEIFLEGVIYYATLSKRIVYTNCITGR